MTDLGSKLSGVVLAGGRSSRMGRDKAGLEWEGETFLARVVDAVGRGTGGNVVVVRAPGQSLPGVGALVVEDEREGVGPLMGIAAGLEASEADVVFVAAVDLPRLTSDVVARIAAALREEDDAAVPVTDRDHPLAAAYRREVALAAARSLLDAGERRAMALLGELRVRRVRDVDPAALLNVNSPGDLDRARAG